jgi:NADH-quinone oxidoreductase subunit N
MNAGMGEMAQMTADTGQLLPEVILLVAAVVGLVAGLFLPRDRQWLVAILVAVAAVAALVATVALSGRPIQAIFDGSFATDRAQSLVRVVILSSLLLVVCLSVERVRGDIRETEYYVSLVFASLGALLLAGATDLMLVVVTYLLSSVPQYFLAAFAKDTRGTEAAMKYFLMGSLLGTVMLYGFTLLYGLGGATAYQPLADNLGQGADVGAALAVATVAGLAGLAFKLGAVPAHFWVPDVTEGVCAPVAAFVTTVPKVAGLLAMARLLWGVIPAEAVGWPLLVGVLAAATMTLGNLAALWQNSPRRLLAYSTISQVGYLLIAVAVAGRSSLALPGLLYYAAAYAVMNLGAFAVVVELPRARTLGSYAGLARSQPLLALSLLACLLSLVGIPPLGGFVGKLTVFSAAIDGGMTWLAAVAAANTVLSVFYYLRWIAPAYLAAPVEQDALVPAGLWARIGAYTAAVGVVGIGVAGRVLLDLAPARFGSL